MAVFTLKLPDRYAASAVIEVDARQPNGTAASLALPPPTVDDEIAAITSRSVAVKVIEKLDLRNDPEFRDNTVGDLDNGDAIAHLIGGGTAPTTPQHYDAIFEKFASALTVKRVRSARLIEIAASSSNAGTAAKIANTVAEVYLEAAGEAGALATIAAKDAIEGKIASLRIKVADAERRAEKLSREALDSAKQELQAVRSEVAAERQVLDGLLSQRSKTADPNARPSPRSRLIQHASIPANPAGPNRLQMILLALAGGLLAGVGLAVVRDHPVSAAIRADDIARDLGLAHLSSVPELAVATGDPVAALRALRMIMAEPRGLFTKAIAGARFEIDVRGMTGVPRLILVASSLPTEGSETIASNLAHQYAAIGRSVLLVDGDLRHATLTRSLAPAAATGLLDVLARDLDFETAVLRDSTTGLNFLPAMRENPVEACPPDMLASARMAAVCAFMKRKFETVIVCATALLPLPDARMLAEHADQVVLVMAWQKTPTEIARRALRCLGHSRRKVAGVVMNEVAEADVAQSIQAGTEFGMQVPRRAA